MSFRNVTTGKSRAFGGTEIHVEQTSIPDLDLPEACTLGSRSGRTSTRSGVGVGRGADYGFSR